MGLKVHDVRFPTWGAAVSCIIKIEYPRQGFVNDALMQCMGAPWLNTKMVVAVSPDTDVDDPADVYFAIASRADPARDVFIVPNTRCNFGDPSGEPVAGVYPAPGSWARSASTRPAKPRHDPLGLRPRLAEGLGQGRSGRLPGLARRSAPRISILDQRPGFSALEQQPGSARPRQPDEVRHDRTAGLESDPIIPYADPADLPAALRSAIESYAQRMGFCPMR